MSYGKLKIDEYLKHNTPRLFLRSARRAMNLSLRELSDRSHWSLAYIAQAETGRCDMSVKMAKDLACVLMVRDWWSLCEKFTYEEKGGKARFIGDNGTIFVIDNLK